MNFLKKYRIYVFEFLLFAAMLAVDLISKSAVFAFLEQKGGSYVVFEGIYTLVEVKNFGASFGIFSGKTTLLTVFTAIAMIALFVLLVVRPKTPALFRVGIVTVIAGGVGNLVDRIAFGYVRDFIDYTFLETFFGIDFAVGNIADIFILVGVLCLIVYIIFGYKEGDFAKNPHVKDGFDIPDNSVKDMTKEGEEKLEGDPVMPNKKEKGDVVGDEKRD